MRQAIQHWFEGLRSQLFSVRPELDDECAELLKRIPKGTLSLEHLWQFFWDKPLWANIRRCAISKTHKIILENGVPSYASLGSKAWEFDYLGKESRKGGHWRSEDRWKPVGRLSKAYFRRRFSEEIPVRIAVWRVAQITSFAQLLVKCERDKLDANALLQLASSSVISTIDLNTLRSVKSSLCTGWGITTLLHGLTDLGIAIKPDIHFARACIWSGMIDASMTGWSKEDINAWLQRDSNKLLLVNSARCLAVLLNGTRPSLRKTLREVDFVLMNCSDAGLLRIHNRSFPGWSPR